MIRYGTGKAGQYAKGKAQKLFNRLLTTIIVTSFAAGLLAGICLGIGALPFVLRYAGWTRRVPLATYLGLVIGLEVLAGCAISLIFRAFSGPRDRMSRERIKYMRGGQTEALIAFALGPLNNRWHLFNGVAMKGGGDIDHVLVGPGGLFCISTKATRGIYSRGSDGRLLLNGEPNEDVAQAQRLAMTLRHWLEARLQSHHGVKTIPFVQPILAAPFAFIDFPNKAMNVWVMDDVQLFDEAFDAPDKLKESTIRGCVAVLKDLTGWQEATMCGRQV